MMFSLAAALDFALDEPWRLFGTAMGLPLLAMS